MPSGNGRRPRPGRTDGRRSASMGRPCAALPTCSCRVCICWRLTPTRRASCCGNCRSTPRPTSQTVFGVTSLGRQRADARQLLKLVRGHWGIENKVFHVRDQTMGEDACRVRKRSAPVILSTLRNGVLNVLQRLGVRNRAAQFRTFCADPVKALHAIQRK